LPYLLSDKSSTIARVDDLPAGGGAASLIDAWQLDDLDGKPEGLAFTAEGRAGSTRESRARISFCEFRGNPAGDSDLMSATVPI
jgi:hypothetical protein